MALGFCFHTQDEFFSLKILLKFYSEGIFAEFSRMPKNMELY